VPIKVEQRLLGRLLELEQQVQVLMLFGQQPMLTQRQPVVIGPPVELQFVPPIIFINFNLVFLVHH
jgi:hypothetical protein